MSERILHEKLREWANARPFSFNEAWREFDVAGNDNMLAAFADEIKRCYVPVPRFENGEPVGEGSETYYGTVEAIDVEVSDGGWGNYVMHFADGNCIEGTYSQTITTMITTGGCIPSIGQATTHQKPLGPRICTLWNEWSICTETENVTTTR